MRLPSLPTVPIVNHLNTLYFNQTWNAPADHGEVNFLLNKASARLAIGAVPVSQSVVGLPTTDAVYAVYRCAPSMFGRYVSFPSRLWIKDTYFTDTYGVSLTSYAVTGRVIPKGGIWLYYDPYRSIVFVAINKVYTSACIGESYPQLYISVYKDTSRASPITSQLYLVTPSSGSASVDYVNAMIADAALHYPNGVFVWVNGWMYASDTIPALNKNDVVCLVIDPDIVGYCDIQIDNNQTGYYSQEYGEYREILHLPKSINPSNIIITHDTLTIGIFDSSSNKGVYGHRVDDHAVESVTHNDFSMSRTVLNAFTNSLDAQGIYVRLWIRYPTKPLLLTNDVNYLSSLYTLSDDDIQKQLASVSPSQIPEWSASHLEQSAFLDLLYAFGGFYGNTSLSQYAAAMGYYDVASSLSQAVHYYTYQNGQVVIEKPARLVGCVCDVLVYADGRKVPHSYVITSDYSDKNFLLSFEASSYITTGSRICVYVIERNLRIPQMFNPTKDTPSVTLDNDDYQLVKIITYPTAKPVWNDIATKGYHVLPVSPADYQITSINQGYSYTVNPSHYGDQFYLTPSYGVSQSLYSLDDYLNNQQAIILSLETIDAQGNFIPLIAYQTMEIYLNGYRLIEDLDYSCQLIQGDNADVIQNLLMISNQNYLDFSVSGNILEVVVHGDTIVSSDTGYVLSNYFTRQNSPLVWSASSGRAFAGGKLIEQVQEQGDFLVSQNPVANGLPFLIEWSLPYGVTKLLNSLSANTENNLRSRIDHLLGNIIPDYPSTVVINHLYSLYSPYLAQIISDVATGNFIIVDEAKNDQFLAQFSPYLLLRSGDPLLDANNTHIDRRFVTLAAHYTNFTVTNAVQMKLVQRLIVLLLSPAPLSIDEVLL